ncbi:uncharacterized protein At3g27210-like isoform X1 [Syzygium oleosum]|uniref:uncharacterized protein At3g27210-like isoform X1 n=1 Tax=Syzygium oleosum TaxID=219896 RepID=UPI0011D26332|nr:uncharacterized protein At3g27210-like isoform X1 [Syzygium oleosum]
MGNCVTVPRNQNPAAMKLDLSVAPKTDGVPVQEAGAEARNSVGEAGPKPQPTPVPSFRELGTKEEMFFESQGWWESDCEDYFSVCDDGTPSRGNTPIHPRSSFGNVPVNKSLQADGALNSVPPPPAEPKKLLFELFQESFNADAVHEDQSLQVRLNAKSSDTTFPTESPMKSPFSLGRNSAYSSEATPNRSSKTAKVKSGPSSQCCLPNLVRNLSFGERKKRMSPSYGGGSTPKPQQVDSTLA